MRICTWRKKSFASFEYSNFEFRVLPLHYRNTPTIKRSLLNRWNDDNLIFLQFQNPASFNPPAIQQTNRKSFIMCGTFSCDLVVNAKKHRQFLMDIHAFNMSTFVSPKNDPPSTKEVEALRRYQHLWLPLVADTVISNIPLIPPPDIAWLWHCHRLAPHQYSQYCQQTFHRGDNMTIEANPPFVFTSPEHIDDDDNVVNTTKQLWKDTYPNESFFLSSDALDDKHSISDTDATIAGFDLIGSARRQTTFLWQVSGEPYKTDLFLKSGRDNYERFMKLIIPAKQLNIILVPTYQIDLMWHTHILSSVKNYNNDCIRLVNSTMYHDDSIDDREHGGMLDMSYAATEKLWKFVYNNEYIVYGGLYCGDPPSAYFTTTWSCPETPAFPIDDQLIGLVGTSSTTSKIFSSTYPLKWVQLHETASDGRDAFIQTPRKGVKTLPRLEHYIIGSINSETGYFHIETEEAYRILCDLIRDYIDNLQHEMTMDACTCGLFTSRNKKENQMEKFAYLSKARLRIRTAISYSLQNKYNMAHYESAGGSFDGKLALKRHFMFVCLNPLLLLTLFTHVYCFWMHQNTRSFKTSTGSWFFA